MGFHEVFENAGARVDVPLAVGPANGVAEDDAARDRAGAETIFSCQELDLDLGEPAVAALPQPAPSMADMAAHPAHARRRALARSEYHERTDAWRRDALPSLADQAALSSPQPG